jgi:hypothetical protein
MNDETICISYFYTDTIQLIMMDSKIRYCLFCMSYRNTNEQTKLAEMLERITNLALWSITLGLTEKESVDSLVSETLVSPIRLIITYVLSAAQYS